MSISPKRQPVNSNINPLFKIYGPQASEHGHYMTKKKRHQVYTYMQRVTLYNKFPGNLFLLTSE